MQGNEEKKHNIRGHKILLASVLCLFGFCLLAQKPVQNKQSRPQQEAKGQAP